MSNSIKGINRKDFLKQSVLGVGGFTLTKSYNQSKPVTKPDKKSNVVIIVSDDQGNADAGFRESDIQTPNINRLARQGVVLDRFYSAPICTPTRMGLMTGRWPIRWGMMHAVIPPWRDAGMPTDEYNLANMFEDAGYKHRAAIGKWHLGHRRVKWLPTEQGFTHFYGHYNGAINYFSHDRDRALDWHRNGKLVQEEGYATDLLGEEAVRFIENIPKEESYFLYLPFNAPHAPFEAKEEDLAKYPNRKGIRKTYAAMVDSMDQAIGKVINAIDERGDPKDTFILFMSDNGGLPHRNEDRVRAASDGTFRGHKHQTYEGGVRVMAMAHWPAGGVEGGSTDEMMGYIDLLPTLKDVIGFEKELPKPLDGINVLPALTKQGKLPERPWYSFDAQNPNGVERMALHLREWKLVTEGPAVTDASFLSEGKMELFNIVKDQQEKKNAADSNPGIRNELLAKLKEFRSMQPDDALPPFPAGRDEFKSPEHWEIREFPVCFE